MDEIYIDDELYETTAPAVSLDPQPWKGKQSILLLEVQHVAYLFPQHEGHRRGVGE